MKSLLKVVNHKVMDAKKATIDLLIKEDTDKDKLFKIIEDYHLIPLGEKLDKFKDDVDRLIKPEEENLLGVFLAPEEIKRQESQRSNSRLESEKSKLID